MTSTPAVVVVASWYGDSPLEHQGSIACGTGRLNAYATGVAALRWPCGARLRLCAATRCTEATVVDRGPYVAGRGLDLLPRVVRALGLPLSRGLYRVSVVPTGGCGYPAWVGRPYYPCPEVAR